MSRNSLSTLGKVYARTVSIDARKSEYYPACIFVIT